MKKQKHRVPSPDPVPAPAPAPLPTDSSGLVQRSNLSYLGKFFVPGLFEYAGAALAFNPLRSSLLLATGTRVAEISIAALEQRASIIQPLTDIAEGFTVGSTDERVGGLLVVNGELCFTRYVYYDANNEQIRSHFRRPLDFAATGQVAGPFQVGPLRAGFYSGYLCPVPASLAATVGGPALTGNACLPIITRTSFGPAAFAFDPSRLGIDAAARALVYYPADHPTLGPYNPAPGSPEGTITPVVSLFGGADSMDGVVVIDGFASVLFVGRHGTTFCYGEGSTCGDPTNPYKGNHGYPYVQQVWAYRAADLARVLSGDLQPWDVLPYATWPLEEIGTQHDLGGVAFDPATRRLYICERRGENDTQPVIHVYQVQ